MAGLECVERRLTKVSEFTIFALEDDILWMCGLRREEGWW